MHKIAACVIQRGFTYLTILFILAMLGGGLALTGEVWHTAVQRDKEAELLYAGGEYRRAIGRYFLHANRRLYPRNLDDLLKDPRDAATVRHLRKRYVDPLTGKAEWGIVKAPDGGIMGVYSLSEDKPLKTANFRPADKGFDNNEKYSDWKFVYTPPQTGIAKPKPKPATGGATPPASPAGKP
jgi:type II secretory pathway pseudopilin PulG